MTPLRFHMQSLIDKKAKFQVQLRGLPGPIGPGIVETFEIVDTHTSACYMLYRMTQAATMQRDQNSRPVKITVPYVFDPDEVVMVIEDPINAEGDKLVTDIGAGGKRTQGGLIIGGD